MADSAPPPPPPPTSTAPAAPAVPVAGADVSSTYKASKPNPALGMMGFPNLPKKLPSRNWMIFLTLSASLTAAIVYDKREKKRATARWSRAVSHLAKEPIANPNQLPRKLTIYLESPPAEGLRVAQDHFKEYVKPVLAASGLDWEFVQGRKEGDIRAAVAEKIRRMRRETEGPAPEPTSEQELTTEEIVNTIRKRQGIPEWTGIGGDIVVGRHTWKEYIRGLHEGWLGPLEALSFPQPELANAEDVAKVEEINRIGDVTETAEGEKKEEEPPKSEEKPTRPPQIPPYNSTDDYPNSILPMQIPTEFSPSAPIPFPHILGFSNMFIRIGRFLNRRHLADQVGREVAAACLAKSREFQEGSSIAEGEQQAALDHEEGDWPKSVWKEEKPKVEESSKEGETIAAVPSAPAEKIWTKPVVLDQRLATRMRRFDMQPDDEARARKIMVPEEEIEGWIKGSFRSLYRWAVSDSEPRPYWSDE